VSVERLDDGRVRITSPHLVMIIWATWPISRIVLRICGGTELIG